MKRVLIIPAAGAGTRLSSRTPKVLFRVAGRPMVDHLIERYAPHVDRFVLVLHPSFAPAVEDYCGKFSYEIDYALQPSPTGMLDAILAPLEALRALDPQSIWVTWCDQIAVRARTAARLADICDRDPQREIILPTVHRARPYIHLARDDRGRICKILHEREGDAMPETGEGDMGLFALSPRAYFDLLGEFSRELERGSRTGERNFLPFLSWLRGRGEVRTFLGSEEMEAVGINTPEQLRQIEAHLRNG